jgi:23S rRNA (cytosine1962-C5)-methyltransferase
MPNELVLRAGRERSVLRRHPWVFSGSVAEVRGSPGAGETVDLVSAAGEWLARAAFSPTARIAARIWTWDPEELVDAEFFRQRMERSIEARASLARETSSTAYREVYAESDYLPGFVVDRYGDVRVVQFLTQGAERWRDVLLDLLLGLVPSQGVYERSDSDARTLEGLPSRDGVLAGTVPEQVEIIENGLSFLVDVRRGQKTGFYLDQRESRSAIRRLASHRRVLNAFCYTGSFTVAALMGGATEVLSIDSSGEALALGRENVVRNRLPEERAVWTEGNVFQELRGARDRAETFDMILLDPPRFAATASHVPRAARAYKDINLLGLKLLNPGGLLVTFSCSGGVSPELFEKIVAGAALDAEVEAQIIEWLGQPADHPVRMQFPEGRYLKGLVVRRV